MEGQFYVMYDKELEKYFPAQEYSSHAAAMRALKAVQLPPHLEDGTLQVFCIGSRQGDSITACAPELIWENSTQVKVGVYEH